MDRGNSNACLEVIAKDICLVYWCKVFKKSIAYSFEQHLQFQWLNAQASHITISVKVLQP